MLYLKEAFTYEEVIKKSRFIALVKRVNSQEAFNDFLKTCKAVYPKATHYCSAILSSNYTHSSDDGEPSGSAGIPILTSLKQSNLNDVACVVVRYFGGIKLGASGLTRAYKSLSAAALANAKIVDETAYELYEFSVDYALGNIILKTFLKNFLYYEVSYDELMTFRYAAKNDLQAKLNELSKGSISLKPIGFKTITQEVKKDSV